MGVSGFGSQWISGTVRNYPWVRSLDRLKRQATAWTGLERDRSLWHVGKSYEKGLVFREFETSGVAHDSGRIGTTRTSEVLPKILYLAAEERAFGVLSGIQSSKELKFQMGAMFPFSRSIFTNKKIAAWPMRKCWEFFFFEFGH